MIRAEKVSGSSVQERQELRILLDFIGDGDELVVTRVDRLARSVADLQDIIRELKAKATSRATEQPIDTSTPAGKAFFDMLGVFAEFETNLRRERQMEGIAKAKVRGVYSGRNSPRERSCGLSDPTGEEHSAGCVEEGGCGCDGGFGILPKPSVATEPGEGALDHPPAGLDDEGVLRRRSFHDLHGDRRGVANAWPAAFTGLDRLAVHDGRRRAGLAPRPLAVGLAEGMRHPLEHPFVAKAAEPVTHRALGREALGQERPGQPVRRT